METTTKSERELEIAHVLLIDIVGYSKLLVNGQIELLDRLNSIVRGTQHFRAAEREGKLIRIPTGDGMALLFLDRPDAPVQCALEISRALKEQPIMQLRMGVHSGAIKEVRDVNDQPNFAGAGINLAQRVIDCGDAGHILVSERVAEDLRSYEQWHSALQDLGECEVKHGVRVHLYNLCKDGVGNPAVPSKLRAQRRLMHRVRTRTDRWSGGSRARRGVVLAACWIAAGLVVAGVWLVSPRRPSAPPLAASDPFAAIPFKSIAVLPFANLSEEKENVHFAVGVQDEILTALAKLPELKVISRTSVLAYAPETKRNLRDIALSLGVRHVLEGSVQRSGNRIRLHAQLIDAVTDAHVWADRFDRELTDVFAIQTPVAEQIAARLETTFSPQARAALANQRTTDLQAHDLYVRAKSLIDGAIFSARRKADLTEAARLLMEAVSRDATFAPAWYQLAHAHDQLYLRYDHNPERLSLAETAVRSLQRLWPDAPETHLALAKHLYWVFRDHEGARQELMLARGGVPNDPLFATLSGFIDRRQGRWEESIRNLEHALQLDPKNPQNRFLLLQISLSYTSQRRYPDALATLDRALQIAPDDLELRAQRAVVELDWRANTKPLRELIDSLADKPEALRRIAPWWFFLELCEHDFTSAARALSFFGPEGCHNEDLPFPLAWCEGVVAHLSGNQEAARPHFSATKAEAEKRLAQRPDDATALCVLAFANAGLGNKNDAIQQARRAVELLPVTRDAINGNVLSESLATIYAWTGEKDLALEQLREVVSRPSYVSYGNLRLYPYWEPLRDDPRFDQIVESLAPK